MTKDELVRQKWYDVILLGVFAPFSRRLVIRPAREPLTVVFLDYGPHGEHPPSFFRFQLWDFPPMPLIRDHRSVVIGKSREALGGGQSVIPLRGRRPEGDLYNTVVKNFVVFAIQNALAPLRTPPHALSFLAFPYPSPVNYSNAGRRRDEITRGRLQKRYREGCVFKCPNVPL